MTRADSGAMAAETAQRCALNRNRTIATGLLVAMAGLFVATSASAGSGFLVQLVHAVSEAAVIGGLADWFAITALFRRPLGLPIPHTAIVPKSKDRIGEGLGTFLERHFLTEELVLAKLRTVDPARRVAEWLSKRANSDFLAQKVASALPHLVNAIDDAEIRAVIGRAAGDQLRVVEFSPLLGKGLKLLVSHDYHSAMLDRGVDLTLEFLNRNADRLEAAVAEGERRRWWIPKAVDRQIVRALINGFQELLSDLQRKDSKARARLLLNIEELASDLIVSPERHARLEQAKVRLLEEPEVQQWLASIWDQLRSRVLSDIAGDESQIQATIAKAAVSNGQTLLLDPHLRERVNSVLERIVSSALPWRAELARFITEVVHRWDERMLVERMELTLGADLQYVRITGTLVGGLIGCVLFLISALLA